MSKQWVYTYDANGNRVGLVEAPPRVAENPKPHCQLEAEYIRNENARNHRYHMKPYERSIAQAERRILTEQPKRGANRATYEGMKEYWYRLPDGTTAVERDSVVLHDTDYIASRIQAVMRSYMKHDMTKSDIYDVLKIVTRCYESAELRGLLAPLTIGA